jgi:hypothetical protein
MMITIALLAARGPGVQAGVIGNWDFGGGSLAAAALVPGAQLTRLTSTPYYGNFGGTPNPPAIAFDTTGAFGIAALGSYSGAVMRVPDMSGRGAAAGLMAAFPAATNGQLSGGSAATKLNRYSVVMDILIPSASFGGAKNYVALFQPRATKDGSWFMREPSRNMGSTVAYSTVNSFQPDTWYRVAQVMSLDASTSVPRCEYFLDGASVGTIVWDQITINSPRDADLRDFDLVPDGLWSIATLADNASGLPAAQSGFFLFNSPYDEYGELYVANLQFRDDALGSDALAALGGPSGGAIPVPEPGGLIGLIGGLAAWLVMASRQPRDVDGATKA